jgi:small subunit ribosomal protein S9
MSTATDTFITVGRRKQAIARVRLTRGSGTVTVNGQDPEVYFKAEAFAQTALSPLLTAEKRNEVDIIVKAEGGGIHGQAGATRLGIARALEKLDPELRSVLKKAGHMTRDPRSRERKKSGQPGARKRFQFSKR